jgi:CDP-glucose 4,6-dehydratase
MGANVTGYSLDPPTNPNHFDQALIKDTVNDIRGDVRDLDSLKKAVRECNPDISFHLAAQPLVRDSYLDPVGTYAINVMGTANILDSLRSIEKTQAVVVITTDKCYENKEWLWGYREDETLGGYDPYSNSKACSELVVSSFRKSFFNPSTYGERHHVGLATARAGNVIGGGDYARDRLIPDIIRSISEKEKVRLRNPQAIRPWQHVLEPLSGYLLLAQKLYSEGSEYSEAWNFGPVDSDAKPVEWIVRKLCGMIPESKGYTVEKTPQPHEASHLKLDISKAKARLGWEPRWSLETALAKIVEWNACKDDKRGISLTQIHDYMDNAIISGRA